MEIPPPARVPGKGIQESMRAEEWEQCISAWISITAAHLQGNQSDLEKSASDAALTTFLNTYITLFPVSGNYDRVELQKLHVNCFFLVNRLLMETRSAPPVLMNWLFLAKYGRLYYKLTDLSDFFHNLWVKDAQILEKTFSQLKKLLIESFEKLSFGGIETIMPSCFRLLKLSPEVGHVFMEGTDFVDSLVSSYPKLSPSWRSRATTLMYICLVSLTLGERPRFSVLLDHLFGLDAQTKSQTTKFGDGSLLFPTLINQTPILAILRSRLPTKEAARSKALFDSLEQSRIPQMTRPPKLHSKASKGKGRATGADDAVRTSLITQVQDLFPDLGSKFVDQLLEEYNNDVEILTAHLLEDDLPNHLRQADRTANLEEHHVIDEPTKPIKLTHRPASPPRRANKYDNDAFDRLEISASQLHIGRANADKTADDVLDDRSSAPAKSAIYAALAAFDSDDDERDDTYDADDIGGPTAPDESDSADRIDKKEEILFAAYRTTPEVFQRDAATRRGKLRQTLKDDTGITDEAIEGWALMIGRDSKKLRALEARYATFKGAQTELKATAWRGTPDVSSAEDSEGGDSGRGRGAGRSRGRGRGRRPPRGSNLAESSSAPQSKNDQRRKESNKGSRANHNRRDQRGKKMARAGFPG